MEHCTMSTCEKPIAFLLDGVRVWFLPKSKICTTSNQYLCSNIEILFHVLAICISILKTIYFGHYTHPVMYRYGYGHLQMLLWINIWFELKISMCSAILLWLERINICFEFKIYIYILFWSFLFLKTPKKNQNFFS